MAAEPFYTRHRGPYRFIVCRDTPKRKMKYHTESLPGEMSGPDVEEEARALLDDPRDCITSVYVVSVTEQQHVMTYTRPRRENPLPPSPEEDTDGDQQEGTATADDAVDDGSARPEIAEGAEMLS